MGQKAQSAAKAAAKTSAMDFNTVSFNPQGGPILLEVTAGYGSIGEFILASRPLKTFEYKEFGKYPKRIDDGINDLFIIPIDLNTLDEHSVLILGKYSPAPEHLQVMVTYNFIQDDIVRFTSTIEDFVKNEFSRFSHKYKFQKI